jgi:hypothetical protein
MAASTFTLTPDDQTRVPRKPLFEFVRDRKRGFTDGKQTLEIIDIGPSPHAEEMLVAYLPKERLIFQSDLVNLPHSGRYLPSTVNDTTPSTSSTGSPKAASTSNASPPSTAPPPPSKTSAPPSNASARANKRSRATSGSNFHVALLRQYTHRPESPHRILYERHQTKA